MNIKKNTIEQVVFPLTIPAALICAFIGTGGAFAAESTDRAIKPLTTVSVSLNSNLNDEDDADNNSRKEFQKQSKSLQESLGLTVTQYAKLMDTTRASVYRWHNLNMPLNKIRSLTIARFDKLQFNFSLLKNKNKSNFGEWLRKPLNPLALSTYNLLCGKVLSQDDFIEICESVDISLRKESELRKLNKLLGIN